MKHPENVPLLQGMRLAIAFDDCEEPEIIVDWKSDVHPSHETLAHYREQIRAYLELTGTPVGLIVLVTTGIVIRIEREPEAFAA